MYAEPFAPEKWEAGLQTFLGKIIDKSDTAQEAAAEGLASEIKRMSALLSAESFDRLIHDLNRRLYEMVLGTDPLERQAAIVAIGRLAEQATDETFVNLTRYANYLRALLPNNDPQITTTIATSIAKVIAAGNGTGLAVELVDHLLGQCLDWIDSGDGPSVLAAMHLFREISETTPSLALPYISTLLEGTWTVLLKAKTVEVKLVAEKTLNILLIFFRDRVDEGCQGEQLQNWYDTHTKIMMDSTRPSSVGALKGLRVLTLVFAFFVRDHPSLFKSLCSSTLKLCSTWDKGVKEESLAFIIQLAELDPNSFGRDHLSHWIAILTDVVNRTEPDRKLLFNALKLTIFALGPSLSPALDLISVHIKDLLLLRSARLEVTELMECISALVSVFKGSLAGSVRSILPLLLREELSEPLRRVLKSIVDNIPILMPLIEDRLLEAAASTLQKAINVGWGASVADSVVFACETLTQFRYWEPVLGSHLGDLLLTALAEASGVAKIRLSAALALAHLARRPPNGEFYESFPSVMRVITALMVVVASDEETLVRSVVLEAINDESLDFYLSAPEPFHLLLMVLSTGSLPCRLITINIIERITRNNTGLIFPHFRSIILQLLADLSCAYPKSLAEDAAVVLSEVTRLSPVLVKPTVEPLLRALTPRLLDANPTAATAVLVSLGRLVQVNPTAFNGHVLKLVDSVSRILTDQSSSKRRLAALGFLCTLIRNVDRDRFPPERRALLLLETAALLKVELVRPVRSEAIKLLGILGAIDPYWMRGQEMALQIACDDSNRHARLPGGSLGDDLQEGDEESAEAFAHINDVGSTLSEGYYPTVAVAALLKLLTDKSLRRLHQEAVRSLLKVLASVGVQSSQYLAQVVPVLLNVLSGSTDREVLTYSVRALSVLVRIVGLHIRVFALDLINVIRETWAGHLLLSESSGPVKIYFAPDSVVTDTEVKVAILNLIRSLADAMLGESLKELVALVPMVLGALTTTRHAGGTREAMLVMASLACLQSMSCYTQDHVHSIVVALHELLRDGSVELLRFNFGSDKASANVIHRVVLLILELADCADIRLDLTLIIPMFKMILEIDGGNARTIRLVDRLACYLAINYPEEFGPLKHRIALEKLTTVQKLIKGKGHQAETAKMEISEEEISESLGDLSFDDDPETFLSFNAFLSFNDDLQPGTLLGGAGEEGQKVFSPSQASILTELNIHRAATLLLVNTSPAPKLVINDQNLRRSWDSFDCHNKEDWSRWIRRLESEFLKESPSPALRACSSLALSHYSLAKDLFNAAFVACWNDLSDSLQDELVGSLEAALSSMSIPPEVMQTILNLAEFMERDDRPLPMDVATLGAYGMKCHAYAKALYYQEIEFQQTPSAVAVEALISVNSQLQQPDSAVGILVCAQKQHNIVLEESWHEKLQRWDQALDAYRSRWERDPQSFDALLGIFRCWHALGDWDALNGLASEVWHDVPPPVQSMITPLAASAAWSLGDWNRMASFVEHQPPNTLEGNVFRAVLAINRQSYCEAERFVASTRDLLDTELTAMISESYSRAYNSIVRAQTLSELEESIQFCQAGDDLKKRQIIKESWSKRLDDCQVSVDVWQRILKIRSLVLPPEEALGRWIKFAALCRRNGRPLISRRILLGLLHIDERQVGTLDLTTANPAVVYGFLKHTWEMAEHELAVRYLRQYTRYLSLQLDRGMAQVAAHGAPPPGGQEALDLEEQTRTLARCHYKLGEWQKYLTLEKGDMESLASSVIESYLAATSYDKGWYKAWHGWALINFEMASAHERRDSMNSPDSPSRSALPSGSGRTTRNGKASLNPYLVPAIQGFFRSIGLSSESSLQDSLRLLTLWFKYGSWSEVNAAIGDGFHSVPVDTWLQVIPQLIARIHVPAPQVRRLIHSLLSDIGKQHPQALIYPLTVASKSQSVSRRTSALAILERMRSHSARLVEQAITVSHELIRVAILWEEMWYEGLEEASKLYFGENDVSGMLSILEPLHALIEKGHGTERERAFLEAYSSDLKEAREHCLRYKRTSNSQDISAAWDLYYQVFRRISKVLPQLGALELAAASPQLVAAGDLDLAVPGTYRAGVPVVKICSFDGTISVINSKQRPRKLVLLGSNGQRYKYLLKGHEDLRQDERVMQLFGLVNTLLEGDSDTRKRHLSIERFAVVPLSQNTGLIGWVPHCDTLHSLIRAYRDSRGVLLSIEHRLMVQFAPDYDHLPLLNKIETFEWALGNTDGCDLGKVQWKRSLTAEVWLERRLMYTRSLAVMSMVGYILGLGDRHPSNLMIDQASGRVVHIDFGDCFEVAMQRERFPEKVPFRLTRMLVKAMEISGVEGTFRITSEHTMRVLRGNKDSLMAVLEAFVYDPLINWRLLARPEAPKHSTFTNSSSGYSEIGLEDDNRTSGSLGFPVNFSSSRRVRRDSEISRLEDESINRPEVVNAGALDVINRVSNKLSGRDFVGLNLDVPLQVHRLIEEASAVENLCQAYVGWCAFW